MSGVEPAAIAQARELLHRFLVNRRSRTLEAYLLDLGDFARVVDKELVAAVAQLLTGSESACRRLLIRYAVDLRLRGRAPATSARRMATLRALVRMARRMGLIDWDVSIPTGREIRAALQWSTVTENVHYLLPRDPREIDRLDLQHYALREALGGNYLAPVGVPVRVLDAGCGTGQWAFELCSEFPRAMVVGVDLISGKPDRPPGYRLVRANLLKGLPFEEGAFDFVHQRLLFLALPLASWGPVVADLVRVTRPGGWIEVVEPSVFRLTGAGPAIGRLRALAVRAMAARGLDTTSVVFDSLDRYLQGAGLVEVTRREVTLPIGEWGGCVGALMATDFRSAFTRMCEVLQVDGTIGAEESDELLQQVQREYEEGRVESPIAVAYGRKPAG
jgi:SAM-dependent methyltransferase